MINRRYQHADQLRAMRLIGTAGRRFWDGIGRYTIAAAVAGAFSVLPGAASAALHDRGNGLIYDDALDVTWLQNANLARSEAFGVMGIAADGRMSWNTAVAWVSNMNAAVYKGFGDWRLPTLTPVNGVSFVTRMSTDGSSDLGINTVAVNRTASELANLFYHSLNHASDCQPTVGGNGSLACGGGVLPSYSPFLDVGDGPYWTGREYDGNAAFDAWYFNFGTTAGWQDIQNKGNGLYVLALRPGDVAPVPEPSALLMLAAGGLLMSGRLRRAALSRQ